MPIRKYTMDYRQEAPDILRNFLVYHQTIQGHSKKTVDEYFLDLRTFFRYLKMDKNRLPLETPLDTIDIMDIDLEFIKTIQLTDVYNYMNYLGTERSTQHNNPTATVGVKASTRARKVSTIRSYFKYLTNKEKLLTQNPLQDLDSPRVQKSLPQYLNVTESVNLLDSVDGRNQVRDYCILSLFLNCGLRISELVGLDCTDIKEDQMRVLGKGNKERILFLNEACLDALEEWMEVRERKNLKNIPAIFVTGRNTRITSAAVHKLVKKHISAAGLDSTKLSSHKLRHTAATLMLQNGVDVRTLQEVLGHENLNTTQIYTHVDNDSLRKAAAANPLASKKKEKTTE